MVKLLLILTALLLTLFLFLYLYVCLYMYVSQEKVLFLSQPPDEPYYSSLRSNTNMVELSYSPEPGIVLQGWKQKNTHATKVLLYFGGNAEDVAHFVSETTYSGANIISFNYRSYGKSQGKPSEKVFFSDALSIYDDLTKEQNIRKEDIIIMGRSLGSGVATYLASQRSVTEVILITPYDSMLQVAKRKYPYLPVSFLFQHPFDSVAYIKDKNITMLCVYAGKDSVIPNEHTEKLLASWKGKVTKVFIEEANHSDILAHHRTKDAIEEFLNEHNPVRVGL